MTFLSPGSEFWLGDMQRYVCYIHTQNPRYSFVEIDVLRQLQDALVRIQKYHIYERLSVPHKRMYAMFSFQNLCKNSTNLAEGGKVICFNRSILQPLQSSMVDTLNPAVQGME
jgi:hypothetical protein